MTIHSICFTPSNIEREVRTHWKSSHNMAQPLRTSRRQTRASAGIPRATLPASLPAAPPAAPAAAPAAAPSAAPSAALPASPSTGPVESTGFAFMSMIPSPAIAAPVAVQVRYYDLLDQVPN